MAPYINSIIKSKWARFLLERIAGFDKRRILPLYSSSFFPKKGESANLFLGEGNKPKVVLFADTYMKFHDTQIGYSAKKLLENLGYDVLVFTEGCCQRPAVSKGLLDYAKKNGLKTFELLEAYLKLKIPIVICEPSCATALKDDIPDLLNDIKWKN